VLAVTTELGPSTDVHEIASKTGMTVDQVRHVLTSPTYVQALETEAMELISHALVRGVRKMDAIVHAEKASDANRVNAFKAIQQTYTALAGQKHRIMDDADEELREWRKRQEAKRNEVTG